MLFSFPVLRESAAEWTGTEGDTVPTSPSSLANPGSTQLVLLPAFVEPPDPRPVFFLWVPSLFPGESEQTNKHPAGVLTRKAELGKGEFSPFSGSGGRKRTGTFPPFPPLSFSMHLRVLGARLGRTLVRSKGGRTHLEFVQREWIEPVRFARNAFVPRPDSSRREAQVSDAGRSHCEAPDHRRRHFRDSERYFPSTIRPETDRSPSVEEGENPPSAARRPIFFLFCPGVGEGIRRPPLPPLSGEEGEEVRTLASRREPRFWF